MNRALVIEDDYDLASAIREELELITFEVSHAADGISGRDLALQGGFSVIILDLMLPELEGVEVCKAIRKEDSSTPIIVLTARNSESDKVLLLELGADDFIAKPFSMPEFRARVKAVVRRSKLSVEETKVEEAFSIGPFLVDASKHRLSREGVDIELTANEFEYFLVLAKNPGRVFSRSALAQMVHGYDSQAYDHSVSSAINRLRAKVEPDPANPEFVLTVRGVGYTFAEL